MSDPPDNLSDFPPRNQVAGVTKVGSLDYKTAAIIAYVPIFLINIISSIIWLQTEPKDNRFLRFHALQSLILTGVVFVAELAVWVLRFIVCFLPLGTLMLGPLTLVSLVISGVFIWLCVKSMLEANQGQMSKIMIIGDIAEQNL